MGKITAVRVFVRVCRFRKPTEFFGGKYLRGMGKYAQAGALKLPRNVAAEKRERLVRHNGSLSHTARFPKL